MTFSQTYLSRKNLIATNLTAKGVSAQGTEGLTTLANKILQIEGSYKTLTLTSDKTVLSKYDNETVTLTATLLENGEGVTGEEVEFDFGSGISIFEDTNSQGVASTTYTSQGAGDFTVTATVEDLSSNIEIEDCIYAKMDEYALQRNSSSEVCTLIDNDLSVTLPSNFSFECEYKGALSNARFGLFDSQYYNSNRNYSLTTQLGGTDYTPVYRDTSTHGLDNGKLLTDTKYYNSYKITYQNGTATWLLGGTNSASASIDWITSHNPFVIGTQTWNTGLLYVKNLKLKQI